ncbi:MAG TPA: sigma-54 dependent transcriptional regulator [Candidatus Binatia bacterium]
MTQPTPHILVVDDDELTCQELKGIYRHNGYKVTVAHCAEEALPRLAELDIDLSVIDIRLPGMSGVELVKHIRVNYPEVPVIVITGHGDIETAIDVLKLGASDYFAKPFSLVAIQESTRLVLQKAQVFTEVRHLRRSLKESYNFGGMVSKTPAMHKVFEIIRTVAGTDMTVVVEGETGTGKELVARTIHDLSPRRMGPFVPINCAGFVESLLESELFGYEKGAFTGADQARPGKIEVANGGTLFLDEIESISINMQCKLLRVLEERLVQRLGSSRAVEIDMRVIAASNVKLEDLAKKTMRKDFYYRINVISIELVPLRKRLEDIPLLVQDFLHHHPVAIQKGITKISQQALDRLMGYSWPGNIRELQNVLERTIVLEKTEVISEVSLPKLRSYHQWDTENVTHEIPLHQWVQEQEKQYLIRKLSLFGGRIDLTAKSCRVGVRTLSRKIHFYGIDKTRFSKICIYLYMAESFSRLTETVFFGLPIADLLL